MAGTIETNALIQVGFIVRDIETSKRKFATFLGVEAPPTIDGGAYEITGTTVDGAPAPNANCWMAFFTVGPNLQLELIQPNGVKSAWQDFLDAKGEGMHHLAFGVKNTDEKIKKCEEFGMKLLQRGKYGDGSGEYSYLDATGDLKCFIELLESYPK
ncbi:MAG: VOC family protein [Clostridiales bacterium]|nr:VOC family protein [Clostridiales bacterium]